MRATIEDIVSHLRHGDYENEEQVRLAIVCRLLSKLGWNIWHPKELFPEFSPVRAEDNSRVDVAVFKPPQYLRPALFIEVKAVGKLVGGIDAAERQLRDYNRNNQAEISVLTDGRFWRFYLPSAPGEFHQKCFEKIDLLDVSAALDDVELVFVAFLSRASFDSGVAIEEANRYLKRTDAQRIMDEVLPLAQRDADENPALSLVQCFVKRCSDRGVDCLPDEALKFITVSRGKPAPTFGTATVSPAIRNQIVKISEQNSVIKETGIANIPVSTLSKSEKFEIGTVRDNATYRIQQMSKGTDATGKSLGRKFVVFAGSTAAEPSSGFIAEEKQDKGYYRLYRQLIKGMLLVPEEKNGRSVYRLTKNYEFDSWSAAASVFLGISASGPREWKEVK